MVISDRVLLFTGNWDDDHLVYKFFKKNACECEISDHDNGLAELSVRRPRGWNEDLYPHPDSNDTEIEMSVFSPAIVYVRQSRVSVGRAEFMYERLDQCQLAQIVQPRSFWQSLRLRLFYSLRLLSISVRTTSVVGCAVRSLVRSLPLRLSR